MITEKFYYITSENGNIFFNFLFSCNIVVRLKNTRKQSDSILYSLSDAYHFAKMIDEKKYPVICIQEQKFYKQFKNTKPTENEKQFKKRAVN